MLTHSQKKRGRFFLNRDGFLANHPGAKRENYLIVFFFSYQELLY